MFKKERFIIKEEKKKEPKYLEHSAHAEVLERIKTPKQLEKEEEDNDDNN